MKPMAPPARISQGDRVLRLCAMWLKDIHLAEDATQETFL